MRIVAGATHIVGEVAICQPRVLPIDPAPHVLDAAVADSEPLRTQHILESRPKSNIGVADREPFEDVIIRRHDVEEAKAAGAIEDRFAVAGAANHDRLLGRSLESKYVGAIEGYSQ